MGPSKNSDFHVLARRSRAQRMEHMGLYVTERARPQRRQNVKSAFLGGD